MYSSTKALLHTNACWRNEMHFTYYEGAREVRPTRRGVQPTNTFSASIRDHLVHPISPISTEYLKRPSSYRGTPRLSISRLINNTSPSFFLTPKTSNTTLPSLNLTACLTYSKLASFPTQSIKTGYISPSAQPQSPSKHTNASHAVSKSCL